MFPTSNDPTSLASAQANILASTKQTVGALNAAITVDYQLKCANDAASINIGRPAPLPWPTVPLGYVVGPPDPNGFQWPVPGTTPVCDAIPEPPSQMPATPVPNTIRIGIQVYPGWFQALDGDTIPGGKKVVGVSSDGVFGEFEKFSSMGNGVYEKVG